MISAELKYRTYVPYDYIAIKFACLKFNGNSKITYVLHDIAHLIEYEKLRTNSYKIEYLTTKIDTLKKKIASLRNNIVTIKKKHRLLFLHKESHLLVKKLVEEINNLNSQITSLQSKIDKLNDDRFYDAYQLKNKFKDLLSTLEFSCRSSHKIDDITYAEIYEYSGDEKQLLEKAKNMYDILKDKITIKSQKSLKDFELENDINR